MEFEKAPDFNIYSAIMKVVDEYTGQNGNRQPRYQFYPYPQRLAVLSEMLRIHVLRERGDIKLYLKMQKEIFNLDPKQKRKSDINIFSIVSWLDSELDLIKQTTPEDNVLVISALVFGQSYAEKMIKYTLPSMMAFENLPCLAVEKRVIFFIQADEEAKGVLEASDIVKAMKAIGILFDYVEVPKELTKLDTIITYWLLGASATLGIAYAKSMNAAFHHSYPDIVYSNKFFSELLRLSKDHVAILGSGMRSDETILAPLLEQYTTSKHISIPSSDLLAHHMNSIHLCAWTMVVNNRPNYWLFPQYHIQIWESENHVHFNSPHMMAHWLNNAVIKDLPQRYYQTLDSEMDFICKGENYYVIQGGDEVYQAELSHPDRQEMIDVYVDATGVAQTMWACISHRDTVKFFFKEMKLKINRSIRPEPDNVIPVKQVDALQRMLYNTILSHDKFANVNFSGPRTHKGYIFE